MLLSVDMELGGPPDLAIALLCTDRSDDGPVPTSGYNGRYGRVMGQYAALREAGYSHVGSFDNRDRTFRRYRAEMRRRLDRDAAIQYQPLGRRTAI